MVYLNGVKNIEIHRFNHKTNKIKMAHYAMRHFYLNKFLNLSIASMVFSLEPKEVNLKNPSPFLPKPAPGVPTT